MRAALGRIGGPRAAALIVLLLAAATLPRLGRLGFEGLWCDEAYTANLTRLPATEMIRDLATRDDAPPLFYLLEKASVALAGESEAGVRLLPALAGVAAAALLLARGLRRRETALRWAAGFFAVSAYAIFHARQARSYGLVFLLALLLILSARDLLLENRRGAGWRLALAGGALAFTHNVGVVLLLTSLVLGVLRPPAGGAPLRRWLLWHAVPLGLWVAYGLATGQLATHAEGNVWMSQYWQHHNLWLAPWKSLQAFLPGALAAGGSQVPLALLPERFAAWRVVGIVLALLAAAALLPRGPLLGLLRRRAAGAPRAASPARATAPIQTPGEGRALALDAGFLLGPLLALTLASQIWHPTYVLGRTDAIAFPACALLVGRALARAPRRAAGAALVLWALLSLLSLAPVYGWGPPGHAKGADRRVAAALVRAGLAPDDYIVHTFLTAPSLDYYLRRQGRESRREFFPSLARLNPAGTYPTPLDSLRAYERQARELRARIEADLPSQGAVWLCAVLRGDPEAVAARPLGTLKTVTADDLEYPHSLALLYLAGTSPQEVVVHYRQDWVSGDRVLVRVPRGAWAALDQVPRVVAPDAEPRATDPSPPGAGAGEQRP